MVDRWTSNCLNSDSNLSHGGSCYECEPLTLISLWFQIVLENSTSILYLDSIQLSDAAVYVCEAEFSTGEKAQTKLQLVVDGEWNPTARSSGTDIPNVISIVSKWIRLDCVRLDYSHLIWPNREVYPLSTLCWVFEASTLMNYINWQRRVTPH